MVQPSWKAISDTSLQALSSVRPCGSIDDCVEVAASEDEDMAGEPVSRTDLPSCTTEGIHTNLAEASQEEEWTSRCHRAFQLYQATIGRDLETAELQHAEDEARKEKRRMEHNAAQANAARRSAKTAMLPKHAHAHEPYGEPTGKGNERAVQHALKVRTEELLAMAETTTYDKVDSLAADLAEPDLPAFPEILPDAPLPWPDESGSDSGSGVLC
jgi:hypothetical protein